MKFIHGLAFVLVIVGGLNWLCFGIFGWDIGMFLGGAEGMKGMLPRIIYVLVGLSAVWLIFNHRNECKWCMPSAGAPRS